MLEDNTLIKSDPKERDINTNKANPILASQAPRVKIIIMKNKVSSCKIVITFILKERIINSKNNKTINKWFRCVIIPIYLKIIIVKKRKVINRGIALGVISIFGLQNQCLVI